MGEAARLTRRAPGDEPLVRRDPNPRSQWDHQAPLRAQALWDEHATFTDGLEASGLIRLAGPLDDGDDVLLICRGDSAEAVEAQLAQDPWTAAGMLHTTRITPWNVLVGVDVLGAAAPSPQSP